MGRWLVVLIKPYILIAQQQLKVTIFVKPNSYQYWYYMCIFDILIYIVFPCKICKTNAKDTDNAAQCDICQFWIHMKCNNLNHIDYKYLQGSNDPWFCITCCNEIFSFGLIVNKKFLSLMMVSSSPITVKNIDANNTNSNSFLQLNLLQICLFYSISLINSLLIKKMSLKK